MGAAKVQLVPVTVMPGIVPVGACGAPSMPMTGETKGSSTVASGRTTTMSCARTRSRLVDAPSGAKSVICEPETFSVCRWGNASIPARLLNEGSVQVSSVR